MISQVDRSTPWITLSPQSISPIRYHNLLYTDLNFRIRSHLTENDVYIRIKPIDEDCGYIELVLIKSGKRIDWTFSEEIKKYIAHNVK